MTASHSPYQPPAAPGSGQRSQWRTLHDAAATLATARAAAAHPGLTLVVTANTADTQRWQDELEFFGAGLTTLRFPDWETLAYDAFSPHQDIVSERLATLRRLRDLHGQPEGATVLVVSVQTLLQQIAPLSYIDGHSMALAVGQAFRN